MAIISALIKNGCGFKLITVNDKNEVVDVWIRMRMKN
jgi:hypothetical protein